MLNFLIGFHLEFSFSGWWFLFFFSDVLCWEELIQSCVFSVIQQNITLCCISQWCSNVRLHCVNVINRCQCVTVNLWWIHNLFTSNGCLQLHKISDSVSMQLQSPANNCTVYFNALGLGWDSGHEYWYLDGADLCEWSFSQILFGTNSSHGQIYKYVWSCVIEWNLP